MALKTLDEENILSPHIVDYLEGLAGDSPAPADRMESMAEKRDFPIVGPIVGRFLKLMTSLMKPTRIVEMGSGFGYSAFWFGQGSARTEIHLTDRDQNNLDQAREFLQETNHPDRYHYHVGNAINTVEDVQGPVDCVFIDMKKNQYTKALSWAQHRLPPGGWLIADNVLWKGQ
ncbi:MAG: O-methyltransferase, partial [bacterium]